MLTLLPTLLLALGPFADPALPYLASTVDARGAGPLSPADNLTVRGICLRAGDATACFDTDLLRMAVGWRGGFLSEKGIAPLSWRRPHDKAAPGQKELPRPLGPAVFGNGLYPGFVRVGQPIADPRAAAPDPKEPGRGPLPPEWGRWQGLSVDRSGATLSYDVFGTPVHERMTPIPGGIARLLRVSRVRTPFRLVLAQLPAGARVVAAGARRVAAEAGGARLVVAVDGAPAAWRLAVEQDRWITLTLTARTRPVTLRIAFADRDVPGERAPAMPPATGGRSWPDEVVTRGALAVSAGGGLVVDDLTLPEPNPWDRRVRLSGIAFLGDGTAAVVTIDGDVWLVRGLDAGLQRLRWRRFAGGLHEPQSIAVRDAVLYTFTRTGLLRLVDGDGDGEAERYENVSNLPAQTADTREFPMDMVVRPDGGFYLAKGGQHAGPGGKLNGTVVSVSADGRAMSVVATGLRQPYLGIHPHSGLLTASDQQGNFVPSTPVHVVRQGSFYGFVEPPVPAQLPPITEPIAWVPHHVAGSAAGQVWVTDARMGPLRDRLVLLEYSRGALLQLFLDGANAAAHRLPLTLPGALLKGATSPVDGLLYVGGFQLWGAFTPRLSGLYRVRPSGAGAPIPIEVRLDASGVLLRFSQPVDAASSSSPEHYTVKRWGYRRAGSYGSGSYRLDGTPGQEGLLVHGVRVSEDRRAVFVMVAEMKPVMQLELAYRLRDGAGRAFTGEVHATIAALEPIPALRAEFTDLDARPPAHARAVVPVKVESGAEIAVRLGCVSCHSTDGTTLGRNGPTWKGLYGTRRRLAGGVEVVADDRYLRESIFEPGRRVIQDFVGKDVGMPSYVGIIDERQVAALIQFIRTLK